MRRLDRYIFREILTPGLLALTALTFLVFSQRVGGWLIELTIRQSASASEIWAVSAAILPAVLQFTLPMAVLVGILTSFGRMSSDSEIIALRASGVSMIRILRPVLILASLAAAVTLILTVWVAPQTTARLDFLKLNIAMKVGSFELQPRVFNEDLKGFVLYVNDNSADDGLNFHGIMLAETKNPEDYPQVTFAESGSLVLDEANRRFQLTLLNDSQHVPSAPDKYDKYTHSTTTLNIDMKPADTSVSSSVLQTSSADLWERMRGAVPGAQATYEERVEFHRRLALPLACLAFALVGLPLGISTSRGGKSLGLVLSLVLMVAYYLALVAGTRLASEQNFPPFLGAWLPNIAFGVLGIYLLGRSDGQQENRVLGAVGRAIEAAWRRFTASRPSRLQADRWAYTLTHHSKVIRLLDAYVLKGFWFFFTIVLGVFVSLFVVVTLFQLLEDIVRNHVPTPVVVTYFLYLLPQILYLVVPLAVLLAILIALGTLTKTNEILAVKAGAVSLYRMSLPLLVMGAMLSGAVYLMQDHVLPWSNRIQDQYHDIIKGRATQTYRDPGRKWMRGSNNRLYHYNLFDRTTNAFGNLSILRVDPQTFALREWTFAKRASWNGTGWVVENGWIQRIAEDGSTQRDAFEMRNLSSAELDTPDYFKKEVREADQMTYFELKEYVEDLRQSGFDVTNLTLDLYRKLSFPMVSFIMAVIGVPFSFKTGRRGAFYGVGFCLALGLVYWSTFEIFDKLGGINRLSPMIAAWFPNLIFGTGGFWMMLRVKT